VRDKSGFYNSSHFYLCSEIWLLTWPMTSCPASSVGKAADWCTEGRGFQSQVRNEHFPPICHFIGVRITINACECLAAEWKKGGSGVKYGWRQGP